MRNWDDVSKVAYRAAHDVVGHGFEIDELVNESYMSKWQTCKEHEIYTTLRNAMRDAIKAVVGQGKDDKKCARKKAKEAELRFETNKQARSSSLEYKRQNPGFDEFSEKISLDEKAYLQLENEELVKKLIKTLDSTAQKVVSYRIYKDRSSDSIGKELNISRFAVDRIWNNALVKMRDSDLIKDLERVH